MSKGAFALFSAGTIVVFATGAMKALSKLIYFTSGLAIKSLSMGFFPFQTLGFCLAAAGLIAMVSHKQGEHAAFAVIPLPLILLSMEEYNEAAKNDSGKLTMLWVVLMCLGVLVMYGLLAYFALKTKHILVFILLIVAFICTLGMGYLSTKDELSDWIKEFVNSLGQGSFLASAIILHKKGLGEIDSLKRVKKA